MNYFSIIAALISGVVIGLTWNEASIRVLRRQLGLMNSLNSELGDRLIDRERADDQEDQIARIPEERQIEILENWHRKEAA